MDLTAFRKLTRIEQTLFGLPFILSGAVLACITNKNCHIELSFFWIIAAFIFARIAGMAFNQVIDRQIDARNPRTKDRVVASGKISAKEAFGIAIGSLALFLLSCKMIDTKVFLYALPVAGLITVYSFCKRFTVLAHFVLGAIHFSAPILAAFAMMQHFSLSILFLGLTSFFLFTGSDIIYAFLDVTFDRKEDLYSLPAIWGIPIALKISEFLHFFSVLCLFSVGFFSHLNPLFYLSPLIATVALFCFHHQIKNISFLQKADSKVETLFFSTNVIVATSTFLFLILGGL